MVSRRFNFFWIPPDQGYKLGSPEGLFDPIEEIMNFKKTPGWVILEEMAVLMGLLWGYQGDTTFSGFLVARITNWELMDHIRNIRNVIKTPEWVILEETAVLMGSLLGYQGDTTFSRFFMARVTNWDLMDPIRNIRNVKKTPGWVILEETAVLMGLLSRYRVDSTS